MEEDKKKEVKETKKSKKTIIIIAIIVLLIIIGLTVGVIIYNNAGDNTIQEYTRKYSFYDYNEYIDLTTIKYNPLENHNCKYENRIKCFDKYLTNTENNTIVSIIANEIVIVVDKYDDGEAYRFFDKEGNEIVVKNNTSKHYYDMSIDRKNDILSAFYKENDSYEIDEFVIYEDMQYTDLLKEGETRKGFHIEIKKSDMHFIDTYNLEKVDLKNGDANFNIDDKEIVVHYDSSKKTITINDEEVYGWADGSREADTVIYYTDDLIITRVKDYGAYYYQFYNSKGESILVRELQETRDKSYYSKELELDNNHLYVTNICITKECYANNKFDPVKIEILYNGHEIFYVDAK